MKDLTKYIFEKLIINKNLNHENDVVTIPKNVLNKLHEAIDNMWETFDAYGDETEEESMQQWEDFCNCPMNKLRTEPLFVLIIDDYLFSENPDLIHSLHVSKWEYLSDEALEQFRQLIIDYCEKINRKY